MEKQFEDNIEEYIINLKKIRDDEFKKYNYQVDEYVFKKKLTKQRKIEQIEHQKKIRKQVLINRNNSAKREIEEYETVGDNIKDILTDELFYIKADSSPVLSETSEASDGVVLKTKRIRKKIEDLSKDNLMNMFDKYMLKRKIKLNKEDVAIILSMKSDESIEWKKYISLTMDGTDITKVSFLKKNGMGDDIIDFTEEEKLTTEQRKIQDKRKKMLNKF